jgi:hypothetical protein
VNTTLRFGSTRKQSLWSYIRMYVSEILNWGFYLGTQRNREYSWYSEIGYDSIFCLGSLQVGILSRVLEEVDKIVQEFKEMLYKKMEDPHIEIAQVRVCVFLLPPVSVNYYLAEAGEYFITWGAVMHE